jgi:hypothetical protein
MRARIQLVRWLMVSASVGTYAGGVNAQSKSDASAEAVFQEGLARFEKGDFATACPLLARAIELSSTEALGGMLTLAECYEKTDRPASAWGLYKKVAARAAATEQRDRATEANRAVERIEPMLPRVRFKATETTEGLRVKWSDTTVPNDVWDIPIPIDPGTVSFTFEATGKRPRTIEATIPRGASVTDVSSPSLEPEDIVGSEAMSPLLQPKLTSDSGGGLGGVGIAGIVIGGVGVAGLFASLGVALDARSQWDSAVEDDCAGNLEQCNSLDGIESARSQGDAASAVFGVSLGLTAIGTGLFIYGLASGSSPSASIDRSGTMFILSPSPDGTGVMAFGGATW